MLLENQCIYRDVINGSFRVDRSQSLRKKGFTLTSLIMPFQEGG